MDPYVTHDANHVSMDPTLIDKKPTHPAFVVKNFHQGVLKKPGKRDTSPARKKKQLGVFGGKNTTSSTNVK